VLAALASFFARLIETRGQLRRGDGDEAVDLVFTYGAASYFFSALAPSSPGSAAGFLLFGATVLVFSFVRLTLLLLRSFVEGRLSRVLLWPILYQFLAVILVSPVVAVTVMVYPTYGMGGALLAFTSVALVSVALRNLASVRRRSVELAQQNRELNTLREISAAFSSDIEDGELFAKVASRLRESQPVTALAFVKYDNEEPGGTEIYLHGDTVIHRNQILDWVPMRRDPKPSREAAARAPEMAKGENRAIRLNPRFDFQLRLDLQTHEQVLGSLILESDDQVLHEPETLKEVSVLADHIALSLQDRSLRKQMKRANERLQGRAASLQRILEISNELKAHLPLERVLENVTRTVSSYLGYDSVLLFLFDRLDNMFVPRAQVGLDETWEELSGKRIPRDEITRWFLDRLVISRSYFVPQLERSSNATRSGTEGGRVRGNTGVWKSNDMLLVPLTSNEQLFGVLQVGEPRSGTIPTLEDVQALEIFGNQVVTAIQSARAYETTRNLSVRDSLTNTYNHRYFQEVLYQEINRHERKALPMGLVMVDLDDFKKINDRWGHPVGDMILKGIVEELLRGVREMDTVARYGGEEFAIILPEISSEQAGGVAERLRARIAARVFVTPEVEKALTVTVSMGLAMYPYDATNKRDLIERADQALYRAKRSGKNRVVRGLTEENQPAG
jgi:diguanylate cyclase (GGDEF)-like protein